MVVTVFLVDRVSRAMYRHEAVRRAEIRRVNVMSEQLKEHQRALIQGEKLAAMGRLAAGIAHEITNPLASMDSVLQLMERKGGDATIRSTTLASLREQIHRIYRTIRQLTTFAHPGSGEVESTSVNSIVHASLELLALNHSLPRIDVRQELSPDAGSARVNAHAIQQVLTNLLANALDAVAEREDARIAVRTSRRDGWCVIEVVDNGSGIAPEHLAKVFDPFFTTKPVGKGTGLGLSISLSLVREQGGELSVVSEQSAPLGGGTGGGTVFTLKLRSEATVGETSEPPLAEIQPAR
jgi:two-component system C4-dicarboxylate transport sensor histidine kinase DctB